MPNFDSECSEVPPSSALIWRIIYRAEKGREEVGRLVGNPPIRTREGADRPATPQRTGPACTAPGGATHGHCPTSADAEHRRRGRRPADPTRLSLPACLRPTGWEARQCWVGEEGQQSGAGASLSQNGIRHVGRHHGPGGHSTYQPTSQTSTSPPAMCLRCKHLYHKQGRWCRTLPATLWEWGEGEPPPLWTLHYHILTFEWQWIPERCIVHPPCQVPQSISCLHK